MSEENIAVLGSGSWATALVKILSEKKVKIRWWVRTEETVNFIKENKHNPRYLTDVEIKTGKVKVYSDLNRCLQKADCIVVAVPSLYVQEMLKMANREFWLNKIVVSGTKGMSNTRLVTDEIKEQLNLSEDQFVVIAGPCDAEEVALERLSYLTFAGLNLDYSQKVADIFSCRFIKTNYHDDIYGAEYCAIMKNIIAIASGICHGLNNGDNFQAVLIANGFREMKRFIDTVFPQHRQLIDTAYLGDLLVTAYSQFSRNRTFGGMIGRGYSVQSTIMEMKMVAEGYYATKSIWEINKKFKVEMPILEAVFDICYNGEKPKKAIDKLKDKLS